MSTLAVSTLWKVTSADLAGPFPIKDGQQYICIFQDAFSRLVYLVALPDTSASSFVQAFTQLIATWPIPEILRTDNASNFTSQVTRSLCSSLGVEQAHSIAFAPRTNGLVEASVKYTKSLLRALVLETRLDNWVQLLPLVQRQMNQTFHFAIGMTPYSLAFGDEAASKAFAQARRMEGSLGGAEESITPADWQVVHREAHAALQRTAAAFQKSRIDKRISHSETPLFKPGDAVLVRWPDNKAPSALSPVYEGPHTIIRATSDSGTSYIIRDSLTDEEVLISVARLIKYDDSRTISKAELAAADKDKWILRRILGHRLKTTTTKKSRYALSDYEYLCSWKGFKKQHNTHEPYDNIRSSMAFKEYRQHYPELRAR